MTVLPWPSGKQPARSTRKMIVDPLPRAILDSLVADIPGPPNETDEARAARQDRLLAEIMTFNPRNAAEAMLATHCVLMRLIAEDSRRDAARTDLPARLVKQNHRLAKQFEKQITDLMKMLANVQSQPLVKVDPTLFASMGLNEFLIPDPDDPAQPREAVSAVIVPLHPAPKMLQ